MLVNFVRTGRVAVGLVLSAQLASVPSRAAEVKAVDVAVLRIELDGEGVDGLPMGEARFRAELALRVLKTRGFLVIPANPPLGKEVLAASPVVGTLVVDFRDPTGTPIHVHILPPAVSKTTVGHVRLVDRGGRELWSAKVKVPYVKRWSRELRLRDLAAQLETVAPTASAVRAAQASGVGALAAIDDMELTSGDRVRKLADLIAATDGAPRGLATLVILSRETWIPDEIRVNAVWRLSESQADAAGVLEGLWKTRLLGGDARRAPVTAALEDALGLLGVTTEALGDPLAPQRAEAYRSRAVELKGAALGERLALYREALDAATEPAVLSELAAQLDLAKPLLDQLEASFTPAFSDAADEEALRRVYGPAPPAEARQAMVDIYVAWVAEHASVERVKKLIARYPQDARAHRLAAEYGLVRDAAVHGLPLALGRDAAATRKEFGEPRSRGGLTRVDTSAALYAGDIKVATEGIQTEVWMWGEDRAAFVDGRIARLIRRVGDGRYLHGVRPGDSGDTAIAVLGVPSEKRDLFFGREVLIYTVPEAGGGTAELRVNLYRGSVQALVETDTAAFAGVLTAMAPRRSGGERR